MTRKKGSVCSTGKNELRVVVACAPGSDLGVKTELELAKAALLYGDRVTVISPTLSMLMRAEGLRGFNTRQIMELLRRLAPVISTDSDLLLSNIEMMGRSMGSSNHPSGPLLAGFNEMKRGISDVAGELVSASGIDDLRPAVKQGRVQVENVDPGDEFELLVSSIEAASAKESGVRFTDSHTDRMINCFTAALGKHLEEGRNYLLFDEEVASLTAAAVEAGIIKPSSGQAGRAAQAMTASDFVGRLPTFPTATVTEVLDIRSELSSSLTHFRGSIVTVSNSFNCQPWEKGFEDDLQDAWVEIVAPALDELDWAVQERKVFRTLPPGPVSTASEMLPGLAVVGCWLAGVGHEPLISMIGAGMSATLPLLKVATARQMAGHELRMKPFYFLWQTNRVLIRVEQGSLRPWKRKI